MEHREKYFHDDTAIDKMVKSENRVVQSDKMVVRRETRDKLVDLQMWHARRPAQRLCYILRSWLLYARIARKMMRWNATMHRGKHDCKHQSTG